MQCTVNAFPKAAAASRVAAHFSFGIAHSRLLSSCSSRSYVFSPIDQRQKCSSDRGPMSPASNSSKSNNNNRFKSIAIGRERILENQKLHFHRRFHSIGQRASKRGTTTPFPWCIHQPTNKKLLAENESKIGKTRNFEVPLQLCLHSFRFSG